MGQKRVQLTVRLPSRLHKDLGKLTERLGRALERRVSRNDALVEALRCGVDQLMEKTSSQQRRRALRQEDNQVTRAQAREQGALEELERAQAQVKKLKLQLEREHQRCEHLLKTLDFVKDYKPVLLLTDPAGRLLTQSVSVGQLRQEQEGLSCSLRGVTYQVVTNASWANTYVGLKPRPDVRDVRDV
jgi:predicted RNase H-like nuclease (RuvC/YqgF family)